MSPSVATKTKRDIGAWDWKKSTVLANPKVKFPPGDDTKSIVSALGDNPSAFR